METLQATGALLPGIIDRGTAATVSPERSTKLLASTDLALLPRRLDDATLRQLRALAEAPLPAAETCDEEHFGRCMKSLDILPRRVDDNAGKLRMKLYWAKLSGFSNEALSYLVSNALERCHWFPTIAECLDILRDWPNRQRASEVRERALHLIQREMNERLDEAVEALRERRLTQDEIDALPELARKVGAERCFLWALKDGRYVTRPDTEMMTPEELERHRERVRGFIEDGLL